MVEWLLTTMLPYLAITLIIFLSAGNSTRSIAVWAQPFVDEFASRNPKDRMTTS